MNRHEAWRAEYRADRYLIDADLEALERRSQDITSNLHDVNEKGQVTVAHLQSDPNRMLYWTSLWTHLREELALRGATEKAKLMTPDQFPWISYPEKPRGLRILGNRKVVAGSIIRLGRKEHIKDAMNHGRFRIGPAASYADPSLNPAIQDDELSVTAVRSGRTAQVMMVDPTTGKPGETLPIIGEISYSNMMQENFYVMCLTDGYSPRLLDDFGYDAMLIIHNMPRFTIRIEKAMRLQRPKMLMGGNNVHYYDPYRVQPHSLTPFYAKNFRYAYQREYRLVWHQPGLPLDSEPLWLEIGSISDIASICVLRD